MNAAQFSSALGKVNDKYIIEAVTYERKKKSGWLKWGAVAACLALVVIFGYGRWHNTAPSINNTLLPSDAPAHFYYNGNLYSFFGKMVYSLPEDFEFISEVNNVGDSYTRIDFDGNVDGYIFMSESDESIAYFQWKEWDESIDGKEPYLVLILEE